MKLPQQQQQPKKKKKKEKEKEVTRRRNLIILSLQNAQNIRKLGPSERALTLCYLFLFLCVYTMSLFFFYSKASHCALLLLGFLYPELANIFCYSHGICGCTRERSPSEPNCIEPTISLPPVWKRCLRKTILGEEFTFLYINQYNISLFVQKKISITKQS